MNSNELNELLKIDDKTDLNAKQIAWGNRLNNTNGNKLYTYLDGNDKILFHTDKPTKYIRNGTEPSTTIGLLITIIIRRSPFLIIGKAYSDATSYYRPISFELGAAIQFNSIRGTSKSYNRYHKHTQKSDSKLHTSTDLQQQTTESHNNTN